MRTYGQKLKALREAAGLTQEELAQRMGYKRQANLSLYENDRKRPTIKTVLRHAKALNKKPSDLLADVIITDYDRMRAGEYDGDVARGPFRSTPGPHHAAKPAVLQRRPTASDHPRKDRRTGPASAPA